MTLKGINKVTLLGHIAHTPVIRFTESQAPMASFQVATGEYWKDKTSGDYKQKTEWHNVVVFTPCFVKSIAVRAHAGTQIYVEGKMVTRKCWMRVRLSAPPLKSLMPSLAPSPLASIEAYSPNSAR